MSHPLDSLITDLEAGDFSVFLQSGTPQLSDLMDKATSLFERYPLCDQAIAYALLFGMLIGSIEGQDVSIEKAWGVLMSYEDRLRIHNAMVRVVAREAMADAAAHQAPGPKPN